MADNQRKAVELKEQGNKSLKEQKYAEAIDFYSQGIKLEDSNHILYSNRSAAYCHVGKYVDALKDAEKVVSLKPDWPRGYSRQGTALQYLNRYKEAISVLEEGLKYDPNNQQMLESLNDSKAKLKDSEFKNPFEDPLLIQKLEDDPKTTEWMKEPDYRGLIEALEKNPRDTEKLADPRILETLGVLMGFEVNIPDDEMMNGDAPQGTKKETPTQSQPKKDTQKEAEKAVEEKEKGNAAYIKNELDKALEHYGKAIELDPTNIAFYTNRAAVYLKKHEFNECIKACDKAIEVGRKSRADNKAIAKAFTRKGDAYCEQKKYEEALKCYHESLSKNPDPNINKKVVEVMQEQERQAEDEKKRINELFKMDPAGSSEFNNPFDDPHLKEKLKAHPKTTEWLKEPDYCGLLTSLKDSPKDPTKLADPRILETLGVLLGFDVNTPDDEMINGNAPQGTKKETPKQSQPKKDTQKGAEKETRKALLKAVEEKEKGNAAYDNNKFDKALEHYGKAIELDPTNIVFYSNRAAVYFEKHEFDECIKVCDEAIEVGRKNKADCKAIAKAFARKGKAYHELKKFEEALKCYNTSKSLSENSDINKRIVELKNVMEEQKRQASLNPT